MNINNNILYLVLTAIFELWIERSMIDNIMNYLKLLLFNWLPEFYLKDKTFIHFISIHKTNNRIYCYMALSTNNPLDVVWDIGLARAESIIFQTSKDYKIRSSRLSLWIDWLLLFLYLQNMNWSENLEANR